MDKIPGWVLIALSFLEMTPVGATAKKVKAALEDGTVTKPEIGDILAQAAKDAKALYPGDVPEEQLAVEVTEALAKYFHAKFPPAPQA